MAVNRTRRQRKSEKATRFLTKKSKELLELLNKGVFKNSNYYTFYFKKWRSETEYGLIEIFGEDANEVKKFKDAMSSYNVTGTEVQLTKHRQRIMLTAAAEIDAILSSIKEHGISEIQESAIPAKAFIAHVDKKRIDEGRAIQLIEQALSELPHLKELHHDNEEVKLWHDRVYDIINAGLDVYDKVNFWCSGAPSVDVRSLSDSARQKHYLEDLESHETALKSIIQKYEILEFEAQPTAAAEPPSRKAEVLNYLFDKMQFHPLVITASKSLFESGHYAQAILEAFKAVNNLIKKKTGLNLDGKQLMAEAFNEKEPVIKLNELKTQSDRDEQEGFKFLFMGAMVGIRNPKAHDNVVQIDPYRTLEYLGFASLLMKRAEEGKVKRRRKYVQNI
jgi:uncharacterized protein (TIGR02391 family)